MVAKVISPGVNSFSPFGKSMVPVPIGYKRHYIQASPRLALAQLEDQANVNTSATRMVDQLLELLLRLR